MKPQVTSVGSPFLSPLTRGFEPLARTQRDVGEETFGADSYQPTSLAVAPDSVTSTPSVSAEARPQSGAPAGSISPNDVAPLEKAEAPRSPTVLSLVDDDIAPLEGPSFLQSLQGAAARVGENVASLLGGPIGPLKADLARINAFESQAALLQTPEQFAAKTVQLKARLAAGESMDSLRPEAYAVAREAARQATGMRAFDAQVLGALAMDDGNISEMRTGEGKTLTAVLPLYLNALAGKGAHLITVNETLAKRDAEWMGPIFSRLGMTVGNVSEQQTPEEKRAGYSCDVTYVSDRALGFDFLRDRSVYRPEDRVQRPFFFALVDEVDEVLLDEARTPMIISTSAAAPSSDYALFDPIIKSLIPGQDFKIDEERQAAWPTDGGLRFVENAVVLQQARQTLASSLPGSPEAVQAQASVDQTVTLQSAIRGENSWRHQMDDLDSQKPHFVARSLGFSGGYNQDAADEVRLALQQASDLRSTLAAQTPALDLYGQDSMDRLPALQASLKAHALFRKGKDYTVENGEVKIVDGNKGRVSAGKRYGRGLHQALEAKEGLEVRAETQSTARITMPELMANYQRKAGMTGTGKTAEAEFGESYGLQVVQIPTNKPVVRLDKPDIVFSSKEAKLAKVVERAIAEASSGRPVLVGTIAVNSNQDLAARLLKAGWPSDRLQVLNAETVREGADTNDPDAGRSGAITLVTGDRAKLVQADPYNYKRLAGTALGLLQQGQPVLLEVGTRRDAEEAQAWLASFSPVEILAGAPEPGKSGVQIRVGAENLAPSEGFSQLHARDFQVEQPLVLPLTDGNKDEVLAQALQAFADGEPVIVEASTSKLLGAAAAHFLNQGLGLDALPMVCEGKEKENLMVEMAGRSGMITVATNMAGRGADIKPDRDALAAGGLLVLGTERASSRRIDDQLIGRSGRQGAVGESQFYLSLQDDIPRVFGGNDLEPLLNLFGGAGVEGTTSAAVSALMEKAQRRVETQHTNQRTAAVKSFGTHRSQRETWYGMRERILTGQENVADFVSDFAAQGLAERLRSHLGKGKTAYQPSEVEAGLDKLNQELGLALELPSSGKLSAAELDGLLFPQVEKLFSSANIDESKLRAETLRHVDLAWREHLEAMDSLQEGIGLESYGGREPDKVFPEKAFNVFSATIALLKDQLASELLPAAKSSAG